MAEFLATKTAKIGLVVVLLVFVGLAVWWSNEELPNSEIAGAILLTLIITAGLWVAIAVAFRALQRKRQAEFDANVAAKEGIEDRRREWIKWTTELKKHDIDRYSLPMYLLVGEPQGGKSVLLHNSDLHFPFGQEKLSGVGGTRGCDWWFTDEAVVLDLAGRLFTHQGGASDEAEWNAFLALLSDYRPYCPANGIILVLPCDGLLTDGEAQVSQKASRMQGALRTLVEKLEARLPVYVVLSKADRIFGFVECFHTLDADQRNEMFGWSRPAEKLEVPFDPQEARQGFDGFVERARYLRAHRLANARVPEAISDVDRFYAFPNELAALWPSLSTYLQRLFGDERLSERLFFRGFYLTCGLQKGTPIAKVCSELIGGAGESDRRELESLFTKSRAFFIRDLIKKRVFNEKGLVRPTRERVVKVHRAAVIGYGLAAVIAVLAVITVTSYVIDRRRQSVPSEFDVALDAADSVRRNSSLKIDELLETLRVIDAAANIKEGAVGGTMESALGSTADKFRELYVAVFEKRLIPLMQDGAVASLGRARHASYEEFKAQYLEDVRWVAEGGELRRGDDAKSDRDRVLRLASAGPAFESLGAPDEIAERLGAVLDRCLDHAGGRLRLPPAGRDARAEIIDAAIATWDRALEAGSDNQIDGNLGYLLAWQGLKDAHADLKTLNPNADLKEVGRLCDKFSNSLGVLRRSESDLIAGKDGKAVYRFMVDGDFIAAASARSDFIRDIGADETLSQRWKKRDDVEAELNEQFGSYWKKCDPPKYSPDKLKQLLGAKQPMCIAVPPGDVTAILTDEKLTRACSSDFLASPQKAGSSLWDLARLRSDLDTAVQHVKDAGGDGHRGVIFAKCVGLQAEYISRYQNNDWQKLKADVLRGEGSARVFARPLSDYFAATQTALAALQAAEPRLAEWSGQVDSLRAQYETALLAEWRESKSMEAALVGEIREHSDARKKIPIPEATDEWLQSVDDWLADAIGIELDRQKQFWMEIESPAPRDIEGAARWFLDESSRGALAKKLDAGRGTFPNLATLPELKKEGRTAKLKVELVAYAPPGSVDQLDSDRFVEQLRKVAQRFRDGIEQREMARELVSSVQTSLQPNGGRQYVQALFNKFRERVFSGLREQFVVDLDKTVNEHKRLIDSLWAGLDQDSKVGGAELAAFFDEGRAFDDLLDTYYIAHGPAAIANGADGAAAAPKAFALEEFAGGAPGAPLSAPWSGVRFLIDLQKQLTTGKDGPRSATTASFKVSFQPFVENGTLFPRQNPSPANFFVVSPLAAGGSAKIEIKKLASGPIERSIEGAHLSALSLVWSRQSSIGSAPDAEDMRVDCYPPLAPMRLAWTGQLIKGAWRVEVHPKGSDDRRGRASLDLTFTPPIPERPPRNPFAR